MRVCTTLQLQKLCFIISASEAAANATEQAKKLLKAGVRLLIFISTNEQCFREYVRFICRHFDNNLTILCYDNVNQKAILLNWATICLVE